MQIIFPCCGVVRDVSLAGTYGKQMHVAHYLTRKGICPKCRDRNRQTQSMKYWEYKKLYADHQVVPGSYDPTTKMVSIYI